MTTLALHLAATLALAQMPPSLHLLEPGTLSSIAPTDSSAADDVVAPEPLPPLRHPKAIESSEAWHIPAIVLGALVGLGGGLAGMAAFQPFPATGVAVGLASLSALAGGVGGHFLGELAAHGSLAARVAIAFLGFACGVVIIGGAFATALVLNHQLPL